MSTNKTQNYQLHSWVPEDDFLHSEFNDNFTSLDAVLKSLESALADEAAARADADAIEAETREGAIADEAYARKKAVSDEATARQKAINALTLSKAELVFGTYTGNANSPTSFDQTISLGFTPKAVLIVDEYGRVGAMPNGYLQIYGGLVLPGHPLQAEEDGSTAAEIVTGGFVVNNYRSDTNATGKLYFYMAVK